MTDQRQALCGADVFDGEQIHRGLAVVIEAGQIRELIAEQQLGNDVTRVELDGGTLAPGFVDLQVNGGGGIFFNNTPELAGLQTMLDGHRAHGTTAMLPTVISDSRERQQLAVEAVIEAKRRDLQGIVGLHIEGPFFNPLRRGVHLEKYVRPPAADDIDWLCQLAAMPELPPLMLTLAPEQTSTENIRRLADAGITVCAGHSDASYEQTFAALDAGLSGFTHLFNAMSPLQGREPGMVGAALENQHSYCGVIVDGFHVHPASLRVALAAKPQGKVYLVTDAMATVGSCNNSFQLYGETIAEQDGRLLNSEGKLAGSAIGMIDAVRICHRDVGLPLEECLRMASLYPAEFVGLDDRRGRLQAGYRADIVYFDDSFRVIHNWLGGERLDFDRKV